ncbi:MAG: DNRLRE domain-containing protein [Planctomycetota bacterium]
MRLWIGIILVAAAALAGRAETIVTFQAGVAPLADYTRCVDTTLASLSPGESFGEHPFLALAAQSSPSYVLLKFDLADYIPLTATVTRAVLTLTPKVYTGLDRNTRWYRVSADWQENECTWEVTASGVPWSQPGGAAFVTAQSTAVEAGAGAHAWDVTAIAQAWVKQPVTNFGAVLRPGNEAADCECWYYSSETELKDYRPRLVVVFRTKEEIDETARVAAEALKKVQEQNVKDEMVRKKEEKKIRQSATVRPGAPWVVCELKPVAYKQMSDAGDLPLYVRQAAAGGIGGLHRMEADPGSSGTIAKSGNAYSMHNAFRPEGGKESGMIVRFKATAQCAVDVNNDGDYGESEQFKIVRNTAGPITVQEVHSSTNPDKVNAPYTFFVYARHNDSGATDYWGTRHGGYLVGAFQGKEIRVTDNSEDWTFNTFGRDMINIGGQDLFLNRYMEIGGQWWKVDLPTTGEFIAFAKAGDLKDVPPAVVVVNMSDFNGGTNKFAPTYALLNRIDKGFEATYRTDPQNLILKIPAGQYKLLCGEVAASGRKEVLQINGSSMNAIDLVNRKEYTLKWGLPLAITAGFVRQGTTISLAPESPLLVVGVEGAAYSLADGKRIMTNAPQVEFFINGVSECKRNLQFDTDTKGSGFLAFKTSLKQDAKYRIVISAKTTLFGEIRGEMER